MKTEQQEKYIIKDLTAKKALELSIDSFNIIIKLINTNKHKANDINILKKIAVSQMGYDSNRLSFNCFLCQYDRQTIIKHKNAPICSKCPVGKHWLRDENITGTSVNYWCGHTYSPFFKLGTRKDSDSRTYYAKRCIRIFEKELEERNSIWYLFRKILGK